MNNRSKSALFAGALMLLAGAASAADPLAVVAKPNVLPGVAADAVSAVHLTLQSKQQLVKQLLTQSPSVQRIQQSNNTQARKKLVDAELLYAKGQTESSAGRDETALRFFDEALREIASASSLVPDVEQQAAKERRENTHLREAIQTFQALQKSLASRMTATKMQTPEATPGMETLEGMVLKADELMASGNQHGANGVLKNAYKKVVSALNTMLAAKTIVYDAKFDSPIEEFQNELARNRSYEELIPIALAQLNASREKASLADRYAQQSRELRSAAQKQAATGDYVGAIKNLHNATGHLQRSLGIAGVVIPQSSE